ncbi:HlyD family secretion protein [Neptunicella marina]|uniref:HlyD family efflux transporter periplasmic adaptor subunit n=1 Tax=Neptunicella marina TaxID=2125989 RepID=A0A8J6LYQ3_9ALTE|nr:HlyD family efflux transporter periplasmic adaptor subunit [Neptunicella marina]MBC3765545.1 HlyD family efflux transporter periplasmic adaptor subunit [Neptunicella marina]
MKQWLLGLAIVALVAIVGYKVFLEQPEQTDVASGNGRIEATEIGIAAKTAGRVKQILVNEGDFVNAGQQVAFLDSATLDSQLKQANAQLRQAQSSVATAQTLVTQRESEKAALAAALAQAKAELKAAKSRANRTESLVESGSVSQQIAEDNETAVASAEAAVVASQARLTAADATIASSKAQVTSAESAVDAAEALVAQIDSELQDLTLIAPRDGRIQYRVVQPGEVVAAGGRVLSLVDLTDVYMTFFLPAADAGKLTIGSEVRIMLDALPGVSVPAEISYVADVAQFTPKTVETASEREKLMFRVKAKISPALLKKHIEKVKTGLPGRAWVKLADNAIWPDDVPAPVAP